MEVVRFNLTNFEDLQTYGLTGALAEIFTFLEAQIQQGNTVVIERRYANAQPDTVHAIRSIEELNTFKQGFLP